MITLDREVKFAEHKLIKLVKHMGNSESLFFQFGHSSVQWEWESYNWRPGLEKCPVQSSGASNFWLWASYFPGLLVRWAGVRTSRRLNVWNISDCNFTWNESKGDDDRQRCNTRRSKVFKLLERLHYARPISIQCRNYQWTTWKKRGMEVKFYSTNQFLKHQA